MVRTIRGALPGDTRIHANLREALPEPDPVRFRNREALTEIVNTIVRDELPIDDASIRPLATPLTTPEDTEQLIAMAFVELHGLHEGNIARHRLRLRTLLLPASACHWSS